MTVSETVTHDLSSTVVDIKVSPSTNVKTSIPITPSVTIITDSRPPPVSTSIITVTPTLLPLETRPRNSMKTDSQLHNIPVPSITTPSLSTETDSRGNPTATIVTYPSPPDARIVVYYISGLHYFIGTFLSTILATKFSIVVRIIDRNAKLSSPWHALTHEKGALGQNSLCFQTKGWKGLVMSIRSLFKGQAALFLTSLLSLLSAVLVPLSANAIVLDLRGDGCEIGGDTAQNCAYVLSTSTYAIEATITALVAMSVSTIALIAFLARWHLGVYSNPWSICTLASLSLNKELRQSVAGAVVSTDTEKEQCKHTNYLANGKTFKLGYFHTTSGSMEYGVVAVRNLNDVEPGYGRNEDDQLNPLGHSIESNDLSPGKHQVPSCMLGIFGRLYLLFILCGVLILILYYAKTGGDTGFEKFIDSDSFGLRFLFTSIGVIISYSWSSFFDGVAMIGPYQLLSRKPQPAGRSIILAPPTNAFSGLWYAVRTRSVFLALVAVASILSESLSIFLSNVPFKVTQTYLVSQLSCWTAVGIMSFMLLVVLLSFGVKWPHMPVDPSTIAGAMYYVYDPPFLEKMEGLSTLERQERDRRVTDLALLYRFGEVDDASGGRRIGVSIF
ncbi:hypothetical protein F4803DRAFT_563346 [Xylaria telfairii]|nr:hypothetical protein F4803DRAFT_563346 [Xylaria telfairii]